MGEQMTLDPSRLRAMASRLIAANGQASTTFYVPTTAGTYDPDTGITSGEVVSEQVVTTTPPMPTRTTMRGNDMAQVGDATMLVAALDITWSPFVGQKLRCNGLDFTVISTLAYPVGATIIAWELQLERGARA
ncbi:MAG: hypothetical protein ACO3CU_09170 [Candidatus Nanopelagicales bacterium]